MCKFQYIFLKAWLRGKFRALNALVIFMKWTKIQKYALYI